jgi:hypothetical protein
MSKPPSKKLLVELQQKLLRLQSTLYQQRGGVTTRQQSKRINLQQLSTPFVCTSLHPSTLNHRGTRNISSTRPTNISSTRQKNSRRHFDHPGRIGFDYSKSRSKRSKRSKRSTQRQYSPIHSNPGSLHSTPDSLHSISPISTRTHSHPGSLRSISSISDLTYSHPNSVGKRSTHSRHLHQQEDITNTQLHQTLANLQTTMDHLEEARTDMGTEKCVQKAIHTIDHTLEDLSKKPVTKSMYQRIRKVIDMCNLCFTKRKESPEDNSPLIQHMKR